MLYERTVAHPDFILRYNRRLRSSAINNVSDIIELPDSIAPKSLYLATSKVYAGFPSPADDYADDRLRPDEYLIDNELASFMVRVKGDSMIEAGIFQGDVLIVDRSIKPRVGDIVLAELDGGFTIKYLGRDRLIAGNPNYPVIHFKEGQTVTVIGVVTGSMRKFR
jgi:DNA polymerase V